MVDSRERTPKSPECARDSLEHARQRLEVLLGLSAECYWETDAAHGFTVIAGTALRFCGFDPVRDLGKVLWESGAMPVADSGSWSAHKALRAAQKPFADFVIRSADADGEARYVSLSGEALPGHGGVLSGYRGSARDVTFGKRVELLLKLEHSVARSLADASGSSEAVKAAIRAICETEGWECGRYFRLDAEAGVLRFAEAWHVDDPVLRAFVEGSRDLVFHRGESLSGIAWETGQPVWSADTATDPRVSLNSLARAPGTHGAFVFPIVADGAIIGVFAFSSGRIRAPDERLLDAVRAIGIQIGQFVEHKLSEEVLRESEERFRSLTSLSSDRYWEQDTEYRFTKLFGVTDARTRRVVGARRWEQGYTNLSPAEWVAHIALLDARQPFRDLELCRLDESGNRFWISVSGEPMFDAAGDFKGYRGVGKDINERKRADHLLQLEHAVSRSLSEADDAAHALQAVIRAVCEAERWECGRYFHVDEPAGLLRFGDAWGVQDPAIQRFLEASRAFETSPGVGLVGQVWQTGEPLWAPDVTKHPHARRAAFTVSLGIRGGFIFPVKSAGKTIGVLAFSSREVREPDERLLQTIHVIGGQVGQFVQRRQAEERVRYLATHDSLTGLPNRAMFGELLSHAVHTARRHARRLAVMFIDLDRFKFVNDTLGHEAGDALLKEIARRFTTTLRASDTVSRLGGDEFVVLLQEIGDNEQAAFVARKLLAAAMKPVPFGRQECRVTASVGVAVYPDDASDEQALLKNADLAMYLAKEQGKNNFQFYSEEMRTRSLERLTLESGLRHALERGEFFLHYQAKLDLKSNAITGVEALLRWRHPDLGTVAPGQFLPLAEDTGLIVPIGKWVFKTACAQNVAWQREGLPAMVMAVNLSMRQFVDQDLLQDIAAALKASGMRAEQLELELSESMVMHNPERSMKTLSDIKALGVRLALDDFGVGYSSLAQIRRYPIDTLKVDRSFIRDLGRNPEDRAITEAIIAMGRALSLTVVAEGVETGEQQTFLRENACDAMQGYYFNKPASGEDFAALLRAHRPQEQL